MHLGVGLVCLELESFSSWATECRQQRCLWRVGGCGDLPPTLILRAPRPAGPRSPRHRSHQSPEHCACLSHHHHPSRGLPLSFLAPGRTLLTPASAHNTQSAKAAPDTAAPTPCSGEPDTTVPECAVEAPPCMPPSPPGLCTLSSTCG